MATPKQTKRMHRDAAIDAEEERGDALLQKLLQRAEQTKKADSGFIRNHDHYKRTKTLIKALTDEDLEPDTLEKMNGADHG